MSAPVRHLPVVGGGCRMNGLSSAVTALCALLGGLDVAGLDARGLREVLQREVYAALGADVPLVLAVCAQESALGRTRAPLCGALGRRVGPDAVARAFPAGAGVRRWRARLVTWRCGWDRQCAAVVGAGYAARVLALRARIARAGGVR